MTGEPTITVLVGWSRDEACRGFGPDGISVHEIACGDDLRVVMSELTTTQRSVVVCADSMLDSVVGELRRVGRVVIRRGGPNEAESGPDLSPEGTALLELLAEGRSLGASAADLHLSRRTADRRLSEAKRALGATSTPQAVALFLERTRGAGPLGDREAPRLLGRDEEVRLVAAAVAADRAALVVGEGGVGKTALLKAVSRHDGRATRSASALASMRWREYWPLSRALGRDELTGDVEAVASVVESCAGPDLLLLDDLHLADGSTLDVIEALVGRVAMLCACRADDEVGRRVGERLRNAGAEILALSPLADEDARTLLAAVAPRLSDARAREVVAASAGLPLLIEFLGGVDDDAHVGRGLVPAVESLTDDERRTGTLLALAAKPLECAGESLVDAGFAVPVAGGRFRIRHQLIADAILSQATADDISAAHSALAASAATPAESAQHWLAAGDRERARRDAHTAAEMAVSATDRARLTALAAHCVDGSESMRELVEAAHALAEAGLHDEAIDVVVGLPASVGDLALQAQVELIWARASWHRGDADAAIRHAHDGLALVGGTGTAVEASLLVESVRCEVLSSGTDEAHDDRIARAGRIVGDGPGRASMLNGAAILRYFRTGEGLHEWEQGHAAALEEGDIDTLMRCANNIITWHESSGDQAAALDMATSMALEAGGRGLGAWELQFTAAAANLLYHQGRLTEAMPLLERVLAEANDVRTRDQSLIVQCSTLIDLGLLDAARTGLPSLPGDEPHDWLQDDSLYFVHAALELAAGRPERVLEIARLFSARAPTEASTWVFLVPLLAWAQHDLGLPVEGSSGESPIPMMAWLHREAQGVAFLAADPGKAREILDEAAATGLRWSRAAGLRAQWGAAEAARLEGRPDAIERLLAVEAAANGMALEPLLARIRRSLRLAGVKRAARRLPDRSGLLTSRERLVLDLLGQGATYAEIARRLGVGRPAVRRLSESAQLKLGAESRSAAVAASITF